MSITKYIANISLEAKVCDLYRSESGIQLLLSALKTERKNVRVQICRILDKIAHDIPTDIDHSLSPIGTQINLAQPRRSNSVSHSSMTSTFAVLSISSLAPVELS